MLLLVGGGLLVPRDRHPEGAQVVVDLLPSGALGEGLRNAFDGSAPGLLPVAVLAVWAVAGTFLTARSFRWE